MTRSVRETVLQYLADHPVMTIATTGPDGPWAAAVFYASEGFDLYFLSSPRSRHARDLARNPQAAATIEEQYEYADWRSIRGIQLEGTAAELHGSDRQHAIDVYRRKFPQASDLGRAPLELAEAFRRVAWYRLVPSRVFFVDNTKGFGHRDEVALSGK